jgi:pyruvate,water dikinase
MNREKMIAAPSHYVVPLQHLPAYELSSVGAKAMRLGELIRNGYQVPPGFCILGEAFQQVVFENIPSTLLQEAEKYICGQDIEKAKQVAARISEHIMSASFPQVLLDELRVRISSDAITGEVLWAVRSSAVEEDSATESYAGIYGTFLNVHEGDLPKRIVECLSSAWSDEAVAYKVRNKKNYVSSMAVIVQQMVRGDSSGVTFTANPQSGSMAEICINAVKGINEPLVSGEITPDYYRLSKMGFEILEERTGSIPVLSEEKISSLCAVATEVEKIYGQPQDIEWTILDDQIVLLQARPVTRLPSYFPLPDSLPKGKKLKLAYVGSFSPFGASLEMEKNMVYCDAREALTGRRKDHIQFYINGYIYEYEEQSYRLFGLLWIISRFRLLWKLLRPLQTEQHFLEQVQEPYLTFLHEVERDIHRMRDIREALILMEEAIRNYYEFQQKSIDIAWLANNFPILLSRFIRLFVLRKLSDTEILEMIQGFESSTHKRERALSDLIMGAGKDKSLKDFLLSCTADEFEQRIRERSLPENFLIQFDAFSLEYEYVWTSHNPKDAGWRLQFEIFLDEFRNGLKRTNKLESLNRSTNNLLRKIQKNLEKHFAERMLPLRRYFFRYLFDNSVRLLPFRENRNHLFYQGVMSIRRVMRHMGAILTEEGLLRKPEDVFLLSLDEVRAMPEQLRGHGCDALRTEILKRSDEEKRNHFLSSPAIIYEKDGESRYSKEVKSSNVLKGLACSSGTYQGRARLIFSKAQSHLVRPGDIIVCPKTRPFFSSLFSISGALIAEEGGMLSHGAILAREYGIPAVLDVPRATMLIQNGDLVTVNGGSGEVIIHK